ncbi:hypothetical protein DICVIV_03487 [Dictyocaulus viviparus]|uniref:Uncharacterized protein n=1 Tax=Dictyocaulus viviparus TaxID=29172 RepID=A0A0D8Y2W5_DICVI|nr:hypothetical protein DICVIV_03487 [Dictyocaulus viviparus]
MWRSSEWCCFTEPDIDNDMTDNDLEREEALSWLLELAMRKRRRMIDSKSGYNFRTDFLQKRFIDQLSDDILRIWDERKNRSKNLATLKSSSQNTDKENMGTKV